MKHHFRNFMKRLRKHIQPQRVRYFHCGEYGDEMGRPHYHALLFGYDFPDKVFWKTKLNNPIFTSPSLEKLWGMGFCSIGAVTFQSAAYVARYVMKKVGGDLAQPHYMHIDEHTGECTNREPEYISMSLKPGIGSDWFDKYNKDVYPDDFCIIQGKRYKTPRFYDKLFKRLEGTEALEEIKQERETSATRRSGDQTPARLKVREQVLAAKITLLKRDFTNET